MLNEPIEAEQERDIQSVRRALDILEVVAQAGESGVTEIAAAVGLHVATTHNLLRTLVRCRYLENHDRRYRVGPAVAALTRQNGGLPGVPEMVRPFLERISQETGEAATCTALTGDVLQVVAFQPGTQAITTHFPRWVWAQPLELATGRLLVALAPEEQWMEYLCDSAEVVPGRSIEEWKHTLRLIREFGYACIQHAKDGGQLAMGFPIRTRTGRVIAAIGASAPLFRITPALGALMFASVRDAAADLSERFGYPVAMVKLIRQAQEPEWEQVLS